MDDTKANVRNTEIYKDRENEVIVIFIIILLFPLIQITMFYLNPNEYQGIATRQPNNDFVFAPYLYTKTGTMTELKIAIIGGSTHSGIGQLNKQFGRILFYLFNIETTNDQIQCNYNLVNNELYIDDVGKLFNNAFHIVILEQLEPQNLIGDIIYNNCHYMLVQHGILLMHTYKLGEYASTFYNLKEDVNNIITAITLNDTYAIKEFILMYELIQQYRIMQQEKKITIEQKDIHIQLTRKDYYSYKMKRVGFDFDSDNPMCYDVHMSSILHHPFFKESNLFNHLFVFVDTIEGSANNMDGRLVLHYKAMGYIHMQKI